MTENKEREALAVSYDVDMDRFYIPVNSSYEIQTKGKGSSFRIANTKTGKRIIVTDERLQEVIQDMASGCNAELIQALAKQHACASSEPVGEVVMVSEPEWMKPREGFKWYQTEFPLGTKFYTAPQPSKATREYIERLEFALKHIKPATRNLDSLAWDTIEQALASKPKE